MSRPDDPRTSQHECGDFGERFFAYAIPTAWVVHHYKGREDYGLDFHVEIFSGGKPTGLEFGAQVKTTSSNFSKHGIAPYVELTKNNLLYLSSKPYPCMLSVVSQSEQQARYAWLDEAISSEKLSNLLRANWRRKRVRLDPSHELRGGAVEIERYLSQRRAVISAWFSEEAHRMLITDLYFDLHAALDALIECVVVIHRNDRSADEVSHKATFSIILTLMANSALHQTTERKSIEMLGPAGPTLLAIRKLFRKEVTRIVPDPWLEQAENSRQPLTIVPGAVTPFWPAVPRLTALLRDTLRTLAKLVAPWRDFSIRMSGLASSVIEHPHRGANP